MEAILVSECLSHGWKYHLLPQHVFTHGQLYVAASHIRSKKVLKMVIHAEEGNLTNTTTNVAYKEVLHNLWSHLYVHIYCIRRIKDYICLFYLLGFLTIVFHIMYVWWLPVYTLRVFVHMWFFLICNFIIRNIIYCILQRYLKIPVNFTDLLASIIYIWPCLIE